MLLNISKNLSFKLKLKAKFFLAFLIVAAFATPNVKAVTLKDKTGVGFQVGPEFSIIPKSLRKDTKVGIDMGAHIRHHFTERSGFDFAYDRTEFLKSKVAADVISVGYRYRFRPEQVFSPLFKLAGGLGLQRNRGGETSSHFLIEPGFGFDYFFSDHASLDADIDYRYFARRDKISSHTLPVTIGFTYYFGSNPNAGSQVADNKTYTRYPDADLTAKPGDAVKDSDRDGVRDEDDRCPGTRRGSKVEADGCRAADKTTIDLNVLFKTGSAEIAESSLKEIEAAAKAIKESNKDAIEVEGHTDNTGNEANNVKLSQARADAVKKLLVSKYGTPEKSVRASGFGSSRPKASNADAAGRKQNRRVSVVIRAQ